ncbi:cysteine synthase [Paenibacillus marchantiophytorum]|uniref:cysteine synthase n=1 Tax=Paenibacillus marchantiophytorum TaxID=1619310 RepID=A0ABQ1F347_9BACL|nr:cysteine synthase A [Paenibacillus marchantiophytorum]GFZ98525.1 cysteine synthase [Paenibacillus marchantiophytorum]
MGNRNKLCDNILDLIGLTPLVRINKLVGEADAEVYVKLESFNPAGSVKDRTAYGIIRQAEQDGLLQPGGTIIELTSGNTGIGLAAIGAVLGYPTIIFIREKYNQERFDLLRAYGAKIITFGVDEDMADVKERVEQLHRSLPGSYLAKQSENPANPAIHRQTTAEEILYQTDQRLDAYVGTSGTGGTITGVGERIKEVLPEVTVHLVESIHSKVIEGEEPGEHQIYGISPPMLPEVLNKDIVDEIIHIRDEDAYETAKELARREGILAGPSTGAAVWAALQLARRLGKGKRVIALGPDTGERYLSIGLFRDTESAEADNTQEQLQVPVGGK